MTKNFDPYRLLFPLGAFFAVAGALVWLLFQTFPEMPYPGGIHSKMMIGGFLFAYVLGFLMTAVPRMTGARPAEKPEILTGAAFVLLTGFTALLPNAAWFMGAQFLGFLFLLFFCGRRFLRRARPAPDFFVFLAAGLTAGTIGSLFAGLATLEILPTAWLRPGQVLLFQIMILSLVLGIGCRLIPVISGLAPLETVTGAGGRGPRNYFLGAVALIGASVGLEAGDFLREAYLLRGLVCTMIAIFAWKLFVWPQSRSRLAYLIKASGLLVLLGFWAAAYRPDLALHWMHLTYIGGFGMMTFTVASRVTLAHGGFDLDFEKKSRALLWLGGLLPFAALTRVSAPLLSHGYYSHLRYAAAVWLVAVFIWSWVYLRKMVWTRA